MLCPYCGFKNPVDAIKCQECGESIEETRPLSYPTVTLVDSKRSLRPDAVIGEKYKIRKELGRGGMGVVFEAEDIKLKRTVALKFLPPNLTRDREARERFVHEAQAASQLDHPNICTIHEIDEHQGQMYISMACYTGESLREKVHKGPLDLNQAVGFALQTAQGLAKAHAKGIVHRDIKPANLLITEDNLVKIVDFGLAKLSDQTRITRTGTTLGTIAYMSPEQARGEAVDQRTDVWSLGAVLYEMVTGELPFKGAKETAVVYSILNEDPKPINKIMPEVPYALEVIIKKALSKDPAKRYASAKDMAGALEELGLQISAEIPLVSTRKRGIRTVKLVLSGAAAGILLIVAIFILWTSVLRPGLAFNERDKLLIADVDNQTDDEVFNLALRTALEADLQQSPYAGIFDKSQVSDTLRLMKLNPSSRIDEQLGIEICRFAGVRALILPRILAVGEAYELHAVMVDPIRQRHVKVIRIKARGREEVLLNTIDELAERVRTNLGESLASIQKADKKVVQFTTSSWEALDYLTMGQEKWNESKFKEAAAFFTLALEKDPKFVMARGSLGLIQIQFLNQKEEGKKELLQAYTDAEDLPQREYLMISAVKRRHVDEDNEGALEEYRMISEIYPDMMQPYNNSGVILRNLGRFDEAVQMFEKSAEAAPRNSIPLGNLWWTHMFYRLDPIGAEDAGRRALSLSMEITNYHHMLGYALAAQARFEEAVESYKQAIALEPQHPYALPNLAYILLASGQAKESIPYFQEVRDLVKDNRIRGYFPNACFDLAIALKLSGDMEQAIKVSNEGEADLRANVEDIAEEVWILLVMAKLAWLRDDIPETERYLKLALSIDSQEPGNAIHFAEVYALLGEKEKAIALVKQTIEAGGFDPFFLQLYTAFFDLHDDPNFRALFRFKTDAPT